MTSKDFSECASQITDSINNRIYDRNLPSHVLQPYLSVRPVMTKYSIMPIVDPRAIPKVKLEQQPTYNIHNTFNPGNTHSPWSGFASNINTESKLRNQIYALQSCSQAVYVPSSKSDLYNVNFGPGNNSQQPFPGLFHEEKFSPFDPNTEHVGNGLFQNCTRQQIRDFTDKPENQNKLCN
jgi:hypothetical protein